MPVIKRYPNRKLYDTAAKQYVSLDGIADLIRGGADVRVVDYTTGEDLTALILMQVIVEQEKKQSGFLPQSVLAGLVQAGGDTVSAVRRALEIPLDLMRHVDEEIEHRIQRLVKAGELGEEEGVHLRDKLVGLSSRLAPGGWSGEAAVQRVLSSRGVASRSQLQSLSDQLDALQAELDALSHSNQA
jgi:polyhydroxyalkanoate synthesis repressor PhaR